MTIQNITSASALFAGKSCAKKSAQGSAFALPAEVKAESEKKPATTVSCREAYEKERSAVNCDKNMIAAENVEEPAVSYTYEDIKDIDSGNCSFEEFYQLCSYLSENHIGRGVNLSDLELVRPEDPRTVDNYRGKLDEIYKRLLHRGDVVRADELGETTLFSLDSYGTWCAIGVYLYEASPYRWPSWGELGENRLDDINIRIVWSDTSTAENPILEARVTQIQTGQRESDGSLAPIKVLSEEIYQIAVKDVNPRKANLIEMSAYWAYEEAKNRDFAPVTGYCGDNTTFFHLRNSGVEFPNASDAINEKRDWVQFLAQAAKEYEKELADESEEYYELWKEFRTTALKRLNDMMERMSQTADEIIDHLAEKDTDTAAAVD